jgi:hypothetical protein
MGDVIDLGKVRTNIKQTRKEADMQDFLNDMIESCNAAMAYLPPEEVCGAVASVLGKIVYATDPKLETDLLEKLRVYIEVCALKEAKNGPE